MKCFGGVFAHSTPAFARLFKRGLPPLRLVLAAAAMSVAAHGDGMPIQPDRVQLPMPDDRLGVECMAVAGTSCWIAWEDLFGWGDRDFNDSVFSLTISDSLGISFSEIGGVRTYPEHMTAGQAVDGQPIPLFLHVYEPSTALWHVYSTGSGSKNPDGLEHALVVQNFPATQTAVPEPVSFVLAVIGLLAIWLAHRRRRGSISLRRDQ